MYCDEKGVIIAYGFHYNHSIICMYCTIKYSYSRQCSLSDKDSAFNYVLKKIKQLECWSKLV